jgi:2'-deoxynucleoside 5'-phosphate N-hydrolase
MNIYFSCSITGGRNDQKTYRELVDFLISSGYRVLTARLADPDINLLDGTLSAESVYQRDLEWIRNCDAMVAEVSTPSHGVGYEIALALAMKKPVLCCYQRGRKISKMILGNPDQMLSVRDYINLENALEIVGGFLRSITQSDSGLAGDE